MAANTLGFDSYLCLKINKKTNSLVNEQLNTVNNNMISSSFRCFGQNLHLVERFVCFFLNKSLDSILGL